MKVNIGAKKGACENCGQYTSELFPVFIQGRTVIGKCDYWCKACLMNRSNQRLK